MINDKIKICFIETFPSILEGIFYLVPSLSKAKLKSFKFKKTFLDKVILKGDVISFPLELINHQKINPVYSGPENCLIFEDEDLLIIDKSSNTHIHPLSYTDTNNILSWMFQAYFGKYLSVNNQSYDRGLLYRLDYETSGLLYYIKNQNSYNDMRSQFNSLVKEKFYLCAVKGKSEEKFLLHHNLKATYEKGSRVHVCNSNEGVEADLSGELLTYNESENMSLLLIKLVQGSRHQIRVQLAAHGLPIIGDTKYGGPADSRLFLHCYQYVFDYKNRSYHHKSKNFSEIEKYFPNFVFP